MAQSPLPLMPSDRLARRREHLMAEIALQSQQTEPAPSPSLSSAPSAPTEPGDGPDELGRRRRTNRSRLVAAAAAVTILAVAITVATSVTGGPSGHGPAAFAIRSLPDAAVSIRIVNSKVSAEEMTAQLQEAGLNITIDTDPTSPQRVGTWLGVGATEDVPEAMYQDVIDQTQGYAATIEVRRHFAGELTLYVGRAPEKGEPIEASGSPNALAPGALLHCLRLSGQDPAAASEALAAAGYSVVWGRAHAGRDAIMAAPPAGSKVVLAYIYESPEMAPKGFVGDDRTVHLIVRDPADPTYRAAFWIGFSKAEKALGRPDYSSCPAT